MKIIGAGLLALALPGVALASPDDAWPHLRGPGGDGRAVSSVFEDDDFALALSWRTTLGSGYSGIVAADGTLVTMFSDEASDFVVALDADGGEERWRQPLGPVFRGRDGATDGPTSTPLVHDGAVFALDPRGRLVAIELASGALRGSRDLVVDFGARRPEYGFATTPVADGDVVIVQMGGTDGHALGGFEARTGELRWSVGDEEVEYQSPAIMALAGRRQLVAFRGNVLAGHDPQTGDELWRHELGRRDRSGSAIPGPVGENRFAAVVGSGLVVFEVTAVRDDAGAAEYAVEPVLRSREFGNTYFQPVRFGDHYYGFKGDFLTCADAKTGKRVWKSRPPGGSGLLLVNDRLVIFGAEGRIVVARATPEGYREEAALAALDGSALTWPCFADGRIYVRNARSIAAVRVTGRADAAPATAASESAAAATDSAFARFISSLDEAADKDAAIDAYLETRDAPIVEGELVHFVYRGEADDVALFGSMVDSPRPDPLTRAAGTDLFHRTYRIAPASRVEYRFQIDLDAWEPDALNPHSVPGPWGDMRHSELAMPGYERPRHLAPHAGGSHGTIETFTYESPSLGRERAINVYLPAAYGDERERRFPLLLVQDGTAWREKGRLVNTLDNTIGTSVAPVVVAFVDDVGPWWLEAGGSETRQFVEALANELVPELERRYRLQPAPTARAIMGVRDYGLTAVYAVLHRPDVFGKAAVQSVGLRNGAQDELLELIARRTARAPALYVDWNLYEARNVDRDFDFGEDSRALVRALDEAGHAYSGGEARDAHGWGSWRARTDRILEAFFPLTK